MKADPAPEDQQNRPTPPAAEPRQTAAAPPPAAPPDRAIPAMPAMPVPGADEDEDDDDIPPEELEQLLDEQPAPTAAEEPLGVLEGRVVSVRDDGAFIDIGQKAEAFLPFETGRRGGKLELEPGQTIRVAAAGRSPEGYLLLTSLEKQRPQEWAQLEAAYAAGSIILGRVTEIVKGGLAVDVGARGFMPFSRSGARDQPAVEALVGQDVRCRIAQLDADDRNVILDRRAVLEEERDRQRQETVQGLALGQRVTGVVRSIRDFGAFIDLGGVDGLLHVSDISWTRVEDVSAVLQEGQEIEVQILKIEQDGRRISVGRKQLEPDPWSIVAEKYQVGDRLRGLVTKLKDFGAFVEIVPGAEGLIHISEMSWNRRVRHPSDIVKPGDEVEAVVLDVNLASRRVALGLKQALGDPWERAQRDFPVGAVVEGVVEKTMNFGAFVEIAEGIEGLLHVSDITSERRLNHPNEAVKVGDRVRVKVIELDSEKRRLKLGMKQLEPTEQDRFLEAVHEGDTVTGRIVGVRSDEADVELAEGVVGVCELAQEEEPPPSSAEPEAGDVGSLGAMLEAAWKGGASPKPSSARVQRGELRSFRVATLDPSSGKIRLTLS